MQYFGDYLKNFMEMTGYPEQSHETFLNADRRIYENEKYSATLDELLARHKNGDYEEVKELLDELTVLAGEMEISEYTLHLLFFMYLSRDLREQYKSRGIPDEVYQSSMTDLRAKLIECHDVYGIWGSFVASWFNGFFILDRFALGRLQFEQRVFNCDDYTKNGYTVHEGDTVFNVHIPSLGPLKRELVIDAFKRAYAFFSEQHEGKPIVFVCGSWLLYREHYDFLPQNSNILRFMDCFDILESSDSEHFGDAWRVFGAYGSQPAENWQEDTSIRRVFKQRVLSGGKTGHGFGVVVFDGEKIINK